MKTLLIPEDHWDAVDGQKEEFLSHDDTKMGHGCWQEYAY